MFVAERQFASAVGTGTIKAVLVRLPDGAKVAPDGTLIYPATVWDAGCRVLTALPEYYASIDGTISQKGGLKKLKPSNNQVQICVEGKKRNYLVHRILASTFLSSIRHVGQNEVDHIDIKTNNIALLNLRWASRAQNASNKCPVRKEAAGDRLRSLYSRAVQQLSLEDGSVKAEFPSVKLAAEAMGCSGANIRNVLMGRRNTARGFTWRFVDPEVTLETFKDRGFAIVGGIEERPYVFFSEDLQVYDDNTKIMYTIPTTHGHVYPKVDIGGKPRFVHQVVAALRAGYTSMAAFDEYCARQLREKGERVVVKHDNDKNKADWWNCLIGNQSENVQESWDLRNRNKTWAVIICLDKDPSKAWKYNGTHQAIFSSFAEGGKSLKKYSPLKNLAAGIAQSARNKCALSLHNGVKAWAFVVEK